MCYSGIKEALHSCRSRGSKKKEEQRQVVWDVCRCGRRWDNSMSIPVKSIFVIQPFQWAARGEGVGRWIQVEIRDIPLF